MNNTTNEANNQQVIDNNLQNTEQTPPTHDSNHLKRPDRRRLERAAEKEAKQAGKASKSQSNGKTGTRKPELSGDQLKILQESMESLKKGMIGSTWKTLEAGRVFSQNMKISMITEETLVVGIDVASDKHDMRAFTNRGIEVSDKAFEFANSREGFEKAYLWILELMARHGMKQAVIGLEPTGHYWFNLYWWMIEHKITVLLVNPFAVNRLKEVDDNQQLKTDLKDPKTIAGLIKDGRFSVPYLPEADYAELRGHAQLRDVAMEEMVRAKNRFHRWIDIYFPEYESIYHCIDAEGGLLLLSRGVVPEDIVKMGADGIVQVWKEAKLRGSGKDRALRIIEAARNGICCTQGTDAARTEIRWIAEDLRRAKERLREAESKMVEYCRNIADTSNIEAIPGITLMTLAPLLADIGDLSRFDNDEELSKLSGLVPVVQESGKYKGQAKISHRGRKRLRKNLFKMAMCVVANAPEFKELHEYYTTRAKNPLKKMQSLIVIMRKLLRIIRKLVLTGETYDPTKILAQLKREKEKEIPVA